MALVSPPSTISTFSLSKKFCSLIKLSDFETAISIFDINSDSIKGFIDFSITDWPSRYSYCFGISL